MGYALLPIVGQFGYGNVPRFSKRIITRCLSWRQFMTLSDTGVQVLERSEESIALRPLAPHAVQVIAGIDARRNRPFPVQRVSTTNLGP